MTSVYDDIAAIYDGWTASRIEDIAWYADSAAGCARVLEIGAGSGRITLPVARGGSNVTALDQSAAMLDRLRRASEAADLEDRITIVHGDMHDLASLFAASSFDLVIAPFRSFLHLTCDPSDLLRATYAVLQPGGRIAFDVSHVSPASPVVLDGAWFDRCDIEHDGHELRIRERASLTHDHAAMLFDVEAVTADGPSFGTSFALANLAPGEWHAALLDAGFSDVHAAGGFAGEPLDDAAFDSVWVATRGR